jgi:hypothetical protein
MVPPLTQSAYKSPQKIHCSQGLQGSLALVNRYPHNHQSILIPYPHDTIRILVKYPPATCMILQRIVHLSGLLVPPFVAAGATVVPSQFSNSSSRLMSS